jgi:hypothetical protein
VRAVRVAERITEEIGGALSAGVTGENSPHTTNQSRKIKIDRAAAKIIVGTRVAGKEARC